MGVRICVVNSDPHVVWQIIINAWRTDSCVVWQGRDAPLLIVYKEKSMELLGMVWYDRWCLKQEKI